MSVTNAFDWRSVQQTMAMQLLVAASRMPLLRIAGAKADANAFTNGGFAKADADATAFTNGGFAAADAKATAVSGNGGAAAARELTMLSIS